MATNVAVKEKTAEPKQPSANKQKLAKLLKAKSNKAKTQKPVVEAGPPTVERVQESFRTITGLRETLQQRERLLVAHEGAIKKRIEQHPVVDYSLEARDEDRDKSAKLRLTMLDARAAVEREEAIIEKHNIACAWGDWNNAIVEVDEPAQAVQQSLEMASYHLACFCELLNDAYEPQDAFDNAYQRLGRIRTRIAGNGGDSVPAMPKPLPLRLEKVLQVGKAELNTNILHRRTGDAVLIGLVGMERAEEILNEDDSKPEKQTKKRRR